jgi:hypothetical protein
LRDRFDWDLTDTKLRPIDFATCLCEQLNIFKNDDEKVNEIEKIKNSILD